MTLKLFLKNKHFIKTRYFEKNSKNNFAFFDKKFLILNHVLKTIIILLIFTLIIAKFIYIFMLKNVLSTLLIIVPKKHKKIIKFNDSNISSNIQQKFIQKIMNIFNMTN